jgi:hypothetical protein
MKNDIYIIFIQHTHMIWGEINVNETYYVDLTLYEYAI